MIRLFINGLAASAGGGLTYLRNVIPHLARRENVHTTVLLNANLCREFEERSNLLLIRGPDFLGSRRRLFYEQTEIPKLIRRSGSHALVSAGNFALWNSPIPQILLSRNALYTSADFVRDIRGRGDYAIWADTLVKGWLARRSIRDADVTVAPSEAFARELGQWSGRQVVAIHHGFDAKAFHNNGTGLPDGFEAVLEGGADAVRLLFVSHYNYYRNFETLLRAMPIVRRRLQHQNVKLYLTCRLHSNSNPGNYRAEPAATLLREVRRECEVVELGSISYSALHHLYRACQIYVTPAYAESFAHPLVEAMSSGLPVVAADLEVHREICGSAALYFSRFSPEELADCVLRIVDSTTLAKDLSSNGLRRSQDFSWERHVTQLLDLAKEVVEARSKCA